MFRRLREPVVSQPPYGVGTRPIGMPRCDTKLATHGAVAARTTARKTGSSSDFLKKLYGQNHPKIHDSMFNTYVPTAEAAKCRLMYVYNYLDINL